MLISEIKKALEENKSMSARQLSLLLKTDIGMIDAGINLLLSKNLIEKSETAEFRCRECAFKTECTEQDNHSDTVYRIRKTGPDS
ncbi:MAG: hypothetical protein JW982_07965 [Spirochaetes bacterium]|nr:hypothetical protein [Spirochaetota bacterium]